MTCDNREPTHYTLALFDCEYLTYKSHIPPLTYDGFLDTTHSPSHMNFTTYAPTLLLNTQLSHPTHNNSQTEELPRGVTLFGQKWEYKKGLIMRKDK